MVACKVDFVSREEEAALIDLHKYNKLYIGPQTFCSRTGIQSKLLLDFN